MSRASVPNSVPLISDGYDSQNYQTLYDLYSLWQNKQKYFWYGFLAMLLGSLNIPLIMKYATESNQSSNN